MYNWNCGLMTTTFDLQVLCVSHFSLSILQEIISPTFEEEKVLMSLIKMGYTEEEASMAIERCGIILDFF